MKIDYRKICQPLFEELPERTREVVSRRFALSSLAFSEGGAKERETLESIGQNFNLTRERVRQIEEDGIKRIKKSPYFSNLKKIFQSFSKYFESQGGLKREDILFQVFDTSENSVSTLRKVEGVDTSTSSVSTLSKIERVDSQPSQILRSKTWEGQPNSVHPVRSKSPLATAPPQAGTSNGASWVFFLLTLEGGFLRIAGDKEFHSFWAQNQKIISQTQKLIGQVKKYLAKEGKLLTLKEITRNISQKENLLKSSLEVSKEVFQLQDGKFGLKSWPEVTPRGVKDLAYLVFKKIKKPLHFAEVTKLIDEFFVKPSSKIPSFAVVQANISLNKFNRKTHPQTVHNELIKDQRFVLIGRGTYALAEWGYKPGVVKEVISQTLKEAKKPLSREEILNKVLSQRLVKENTVLLNLHDKNYFLKTEDGKYTIREA